MVGASIVIGANVVRIKAGTIKIGVGIVEVSVEGAGVGGVGIGKASMGKAGVGGAGMVLVRAGVVDLRTGRRSRLAQIFPSRLRWTPAS